MNTSAHEHQEVWTLLPWLANGTASAAQARQADAHLRQCAECRAALARERQLAAGLQLPAAHAPQPEPGLQRLMQRLDQASGPAARPAAVPARPTRSRAHGVRLVLAGIGLVELLAMAALIFAGWRLSQPASGPGGDPRYVTLSQAAQPAAGARLRLVFDPQRPVAELSALLQSEKLQVVAGPSASGVWTLGMAGPGDSVATAHEASRDPGAGAAAGADANADARANQRADAAAQRLRRAPGVLFAEALPLGAYP